MHPLEQDSLQRAIVKAPNPSDDAPLEPSSAVAEPLTEPGMEVVSGPPMELPMESRVQF